MSGHHYITDGNVYSFCVATGKDDVYTDGSFVVNGPQPSDYCNGCMAAEPEWEHVEDERMFQILKSN